MIVRHTTILISAIKFVTVLVLAGQSPALSNDLNLQLRSQRLIDHGGNVDHAWVRATEQQAWVAAETAVIVCDVWDKHHCLNAVRRLEEFAPRMNEVIKEARRRGATIVHAPSDCMPAYVHHPARERAINTPHDKTTPELAAFWCSRIPAEEAAAYPIDQSDGGDDDDPAEHAVWAAELTALGRNPAMPWKMQSSLIEIDSDQDFISDKGDEIWNILHSRRIKNVILVGVHTNMCVLGRPFGLRQMVRSGKNVVLMRDMTDCMYNPESWPFVDHFTGNDLIVSHIERFVCPTITSDQILGGLPFRSKYDNRTESDVISLPVADVNDSTYQQQWTTAEIGTAWKEAIRSKIQQHGGVLWLRCTIRLSRGRIEKSDVVLSVSKRSSGLTAWMNGTPLVSDSQYFLQVPKEAIVADDINLLVVRSEFDARENHLPVPDGILFPPPGGKIFSLEGRWQFRIGDDPAWSNIPLPAKFGIGSDVLFEPR
jgi:nicotinamidase-related amidase